MPHSSLIQVTFRSKNSFLFVPSSLPSRLLQALPSWPGWCRVCMGRRQRRGGAAAVEHPALEGLQFADAVQALAEEVAKPWAVSLEHLQNSIYKSIAEYMTYGQFKKPLKTGPVFGLVHFLSTPGCLCIHICIHKYIFFLESTPDSEKGS